MAFDPLKLPSGTLREASVYSVMTARSDHMVRYYMPILGGTSPMCKFSTAETGSFQEGYNFILTPCACQFTVRVLYKVSSGGNGTIRVAYNGVGHTSATLSSTTTTNYDLTHVSQLVGTGDPEKITVSALAGAGTITIYSALCFARLNYSTGMAELPPDPAALASGLPISTDFVRRLVAAPTHLMKAKRTALAYFAANDIRTGANTYLPSHPVSVGEGFTLHYSQATFKVAVLAPTSTTVTLSGNNSESISPSDAAVIAESDGVYSDGPLQLDFSGPVEAYCVYEHVE